MGERNNTPWRTVSVAAGLLTIVILVVAGIALSNRDMRETAYDELEPLRLGAYWGDTAVLVWIADNQGYFKDAGLNVTFSEYEAGLLAAKALYAGEVDIATSADFVLVKKSFTDQSLRILGTVAFAKTNYLIARKDRGINQASDLKGKKIAVTKGSSGEFQLGRFLIFNGLGLNDVNTINYAPSQLVEATVSGKVDAAFTWDPNVFNIRTRLDGAATIIPGGFDQGLFFLLLAKEGWLRTHPTTVEKFLLALKNAERYAAANPSKVIAFMQTKFGYSPEYAKRALKQHQLTIQLPQTLISTMEDQARWARDNKLVPGIPMPNYLSYLYLPGMEKINPEAISIIR